MNPTGTLETAKATNPLKGLQKFGQSVWLDYIRRDLLTGGELKRLIEEDGLRGMTSNPAIFEKAIAGSVSMTTSCSRCVAARTSTPRAAMRFSPSATFRMRPTFFARSMKAPNSATAM